MMKSYQLYKNDLKSGLLTTKTSNRSFDNKTAQDELFELWSASITYLNSVLHMIGEFQKMMQIEFLYNLSTSALAVSSNISRATNAKTQEEFSCFLGRAIDANAATINNFSIFRQLHYISAEQFKSIFDRGEAIKDRILYLIGESSIKNS